MTDNTIEILKIYNSFLKKNNLEEGKHYNVDFELGTLFGKKKITTIKPFIKIDAYETSPLLMFECYDNDGFVSCFSFADPKYVTDRYDKAAILYEVDEITSHDYDIKLGKTILDKLKLEL